jgi:hypothetical protein
MQLFATAEPEKARPLATDGNTAVTFPCVGEQGFLRKVIPINKTSHTGHRNRLISQRIFYTNTAH